MDNDDTLYLVQVRWEWGSLRLDAGRRRGRFNAKEVWVWVWFWWQLWYYNSYNDASLMPRTWLSRIFQMDDNLVFFSAANMSSSYSSVSSSPFWSLHFLARGCSWLSWLLHCFSSNWPSGTWGFPTIQVSVRFIGDDRWHILLLRPWNIMKIIVL